MIEFSIDADNNIPFAALECVAYDLMSDPEQKHQIEPLLIDHDGISKKIAVPFLQPLRANEPFSVRLKCELPGCMKSGLEYYSVTTSFAQDGVPQSTVRLTFKGDCP